MKIFSFGGGIFYIYLNRRVFVMEKCVDPYQPLLNAMSDQGLQFSKWHER